MSRPIPEPWDVLIVGAGVGGAALALALGQERSLRVLLCDRRAGPGNINRGDSLLPVVTQHLRTWGALPAVRAAGARQLFKMQVFHHRAGFLFEAPLCPPPERGQDEPAPYLVLPHPEIERVLIETAAHRAAGPGRGRLEVRYRCKAARLLREEAGGDTRVVGAVLKDDEGEQAVRARLIVGADGASSTVRPALGIELPLLPYDHAYYIVEVPRPPGYEDAMRIELHPEGSILVVPQGTERVGLGVLVRERDAALFRAGSLSAKLEALTRRSPLLRGLPSPKPGQGAHLYTLHRGHARSYITGGAALLGDAVHVTNPTAGQGMTMAIEDAAALSRHVVPVLSAGAPADVLHAALLAYQRERWPKNQAQIRWSHWLSRFYALDGALGDRLHEALFRLGSTTLGQSIQHHLWSRLATARALGQQAYQAG